jgi:hypothetical protein
VIEIRDLIRNKAETLASLTRLCESPGNDEGAHGKFGFMAITRSALRRSPRTLEEAPKPQVVVPTAPTAAPITQLSRCAAAAIKTSTSSDVASRGASYARRGRVRSIEVAGAAIRGTVVGSEIEPYHTVLFVSADGQVAALCTCPYDREWCKHVVATILHAIDPVPAVHRPVKKSSATSLSGSTIEPERRTIGKPGFRGSARRARKRTLPRFDPEKTRLEVKAILHALDDLRPSRAYWYVGGVTEDLEQIRAEAEARFASGDIESAFKQLGVLTDEMRSAWEILDDSDGSVGDLARDLGTTWIRWLLHPDTPPLLRRRSVAELEHWHKGYDDYGVGEPFAAAVFAGRHGWDEDGPPELVSIKLDLLESRGDDAAFLELALRTGEIRRHVLCQIRRGEIDPGLAAFMNATFDERDVIDIAEALIAAKHEEKAFALALDVARLPEMRVRQRWGTASHGRISIANWAAKHAEEMGYAEVALAAAEVGFRLRVDVEQYRRIERLSGCAWISRRDALLELARSCAANEASEAIAVFLDADMLDDAKRIFDRRGSYVHDSTLWRLFVRAAELAPGWAIERAQRFAEDIMDRASRNRYEIAARWLRIAAFGFRIAGREGDWTKYRDTLLAKHKAKRALVPLILAMR